MGNVLTEGRRTTVGVNINPSKRPRQEESAAITDDYTAIRGQNAESLLMDGRGRSGGSCHGDERIRGLPRVGPRKTASKYHE